MEMRSCVSRTLPHVEHVAFGFVDEAFDVHARFRKEVSSGRNVYHSIEPWVQASRRYFLSVFFRNFFFFAIFLLRFVHAVVVTPEFSYFVLGVTARFFVGSAAAVLRSNGFFFFFFDAADDKIVDDNQPLPSRPPGAPVKIELDWRTGDTLADIATQQRSVPPETERDGSYPHDLGLLLLCPTAAICHALVGYGR